MADSDQTKSEYAAAEKHGNFSVPRFSLFEASQPRKLFGKAFKYSFYYILEKAERRKRKNRKKKEIKKEKKKAQQLKERSSGKITFVSVVIA